MNLVLENEKGKQIGIRSTDLMVFGILKKQNIELLLNGIISKV